MNPVENYVNHLCTIHSDIKLSWKLVLESIALNARVTVYHGGIKNWKNRKRIKHILKNIKKRSARRQLYNSMLIKFVWDDKEFEKYVS